LDARCMSITLNCKFLYTQPHHTAPSPALRCTASAYDLSPSSPPAAAGHHRRRPHPHREIPPKAAWTDTAPAAGWEERGFRFDSEQPPGNRNGFLLRFHPTHPGCTDRLVPALRGPYLVYESGNNGHVRRRVSVNS